MGTLGFQMISIYTHPCGPKNPVKLEAEYFLHADVLLGNGLEHRHCLTLLQLSLIYLSQEVPTLMEALMKNGDIQPSMDTSVRGGGVLELILLGMCRWPLRSPPQL